LVPGAVAVRIFDTGLMPVRDYKIFSADFQGVLSDG